MQLVDSSVLYLNDGQALHTSQVAHQAGAYSSFKQHELTRIFVFPCGWDASPFHGYSQH